MMRNEVFPQWITANLILEKEIAPKLGAYLSNEGTHVNLMFLPSDIDVLIPPEDINQFIKRYATFAEWAFRELDLLAYFESILYSAISPAMLETIKCEVTRRINEFNTSNRLTFSDHFLQHMGVPGVGAACKIHFQFVNDSKKDPGAI